MRSFLTKAEREAERHVSRKVDVSERDSTRTTKSDFGARRRFANRSGAVDERWKEARGRVEGGGCS